jgi:SAM-dependent methyltransferase
MHSSLNVQLNSAIIKLLRESAESDYVKVIAKWANFLHGKKTWLQLEEGLQANARYAMQFTPEVMSGQLDILDVGPGPGHWLLLCRALGNRVSGVDLELPAGPESSLHAYKAMTDHFNLDVLYHGFHRFTQEKMPWGNKAFDLINFRGSLDGVIAALHGDELSLLTLLAKMHDILKYGGAITISHNIGKEEAQFRAAITHGVPNFEIVVNTKHFTRLHRG